MNTVFSTIKSFFKLGGQESTQSANQESTQSASAVGLINNIDQSVNYYFSDEGGIRKALSSEVLQTEDPNWNMGIHGDTVSGEEGDELKLISKYREVANGGDSSTALALLDGLKSDDRFADGFNAFRLRFNIGIVFQNIGQYEKAAAELKAAYAYAPEHPKASAGLALADLLCGRDERAFQKAVDLLNVEGDHVNLCAAVAFNAAKRLRKAFDISENEHIDASNQDVVIARLDYIETVVPSQFEEALQDAFNADPDNERVASSWAHSVLKDAQKNRAFLLGSKMPDGFESDVSKCASILVKDLERSLTQNPPNMLLLPSEANNAAVALRLNGKDSQALELLSKVIERFPEVSESLAEIHAALLLQQDRDSEAFQLIEGMKDKPEFQVMASEIEAKLGDTGSALSRIESALRLEMSGECRFRALVTKAKIGIDLANRDAADEAIEELNADYGDAAELVLLRSEYSRAFELQDLSKDTKQASKHDGSESKKEFAQIDGLENVDQWEFFDLYQAANELFARGFYRQCCELLRDRVSFSHESPALQLLSDACIRGGMATLAKQIWESLSTTVQNSMFGWKFGANAAYLSGEAFKAVPLTRKLFASSPNSLSSLLWYVQSLLRINRIARAKRVIAELCDADMVGTLSEKREYVKLLVFCGEVERSRCFAYRMFCENPNDHHSWMSLSASVLALGSIPSATEDLWFSNVKTEAAVEVSLPSGEHRKYVLEPDESLFPLRHENIGLEHPIALALMDLEVGNSFKWPLKAQGGDATVVAIKHKALDAFHFVMQRFEEQFPEADGFTSVNCDPTKEDGLEEIIALLKERAQYGQRKLREYQDSAFPLAILGANLGLDPIDAFLGVYREGGSKVYVSTCSTDDQDIASALLKRASDQGILLDPISAYLLRRLELTDAIEAEFGKIGVTQATIDIFSKRLHAAQSMGGYDEDGKLKASSMSYRDGGIVLSELTEDEIKEKISIHQVDLDWLIGFCEVVPAVAKEDPADEVIHLKNGPGGEFLDDLFASDGSGRLLVSDDLILRQLGKGLFGIEGVWIQALLFHLEEGGYIPTSKVISSTIQLIEAGEHALSIDSYRLLIGAEMLSSGEISEREFKLLSSVIGQRGAGMQSHVKVALEAINVLWRTGSVLSVSRSATGIILRNLVRHQGSDSSVILDTIQTLMKKPDVSEYISLWRIGHFT